VSCLDEFLDKLDGVEVILAATGGCSERHGGRHGLAVQQDAESAQRSQLEGCKEHDGQGVLLSYLLILFHILLCFFQFIFVDLLSHFRLVGYAGFLSLYNYKLLPAQVNQIATRLPGH